ncbi:hypothetical protein [Paenarthrobacter ureafaciens]|uniref:hypothetical protein n=1 Tax=Paenarthrobacter ureafaciens TaxID=37931 RepID=UPI00140BDC76|nr:hypothetical protein [Paenarthrobacter ureafaciens]MCX8455343.1 hypothetical protein [Paenarthrobacter ureafaciens]MCY0974070.1 hypothetical protein [Paenarthrobacter ureafaciens]
MDLKTMADEELETLRIGIAAEQERRYRLAAIPQQVDSLRAQYAVDGGNPADL